MTETSGFKGLDIADMKFERSRTSCSSCIEDTCGTRDCNLAEYRLGADVIYSGGLCPKGNTSSDSKRAPNYVKRYCSLLDKHLSRYSRGLEDVTDSERVLIPRSLTFLNEKGVFYTSLYNALGFDVCVSPESDDEISNLGKTYSHSEFCYPNILAHGHAAFLQQRMREKDKILLVDAIGSGDDQLKFCPYIASAGNVIMGNLGLSKGDVLLPVIRFGDSHFPVHKAVHQDLKRVFGRRFSERQVREAVESAEKKQREFLSEVYEKGERILRKLQERGERVFIGVGRGYTLLDDKASSKVHELFASNGLHFIPSYFIGIEGYDIDSVAENMYWYQGRRMLEQTLFALEGKNLHPVRLTNFNCGPDSILYFQEERLANESDKPWLVLETDGHNSNAQFGTRIQAHNRVVQRYSGTNGRVRSNNIVRAPINHRLLGIPYMGDSSDVLAAAFRRVGFKIEVMPTRTPKSLEISQKTIKTNTCEPFSFQVGDHLAWLESLEQRGIDPNEGAATFMPRTWGPCRFGQYAVMLRHFFDERGFHKVPILSPSSHDAYSRPDMTKGEIRDVTSTLFKGGVADDLLKNSLLRNRPYDVNGGDSDQVYQRAHQELMSMLEAGPSLKTLKKFLEGKAVEFEAIPKSSEQRRPLVLVNGEIFVRSHEAANDNSVRLLEKHGLEVVLEPVFSWIDYVNRNTFQKAWQRWDVSQMTSSFWRKALMGYAYKKLARPFKKQLRGREPHNPFHLIQDLKTDLIYNDAIEGESPISIGEANAFINNHLAIDGIYHVGPLGCMHETIATSRIQALIQEKRREDPRGLFPFMDAVFAESASTNLEAQIAIFAENCRLRKELRAK